MLPLYMAHAQPVVSMMYIGGGIRVSAAVFFGSEPVGAGEKRMIDMGYEELYHTLTETENDLKNSLAAAQKLYKNAVKGSASGDS